MKNQKPVHIPLIYANIDKESISWKSWRETEYLQKQKLRNKLGGLEYDDFSETQLCITFPSKSGFLFSTYRGWTIYIQIYDEDWFVSNKVFERFSKKKIKTNKILNLFSQASI